MTYIVLRQEQTSSFISNETREVWTLLSIDRFGVATRVASFVDSNAGAIARRVAESLNRNGLVDSPLEPEVF